MTQLFYTQAEAAKQFGKSRSTLRRLQESIVKQLDHPDRDQLQPSVVEYEQHKRDGSQFSWKFSHELLSREFGRPDDKQEPGQGSQQSASDSSNNEFVTLPRSIIDHMERQLDVLSGQLEKKDEQLDRMMEHMKESQLLSNGMAAQIGLLSQGNSESENGPTSVVDQAPSASKKRKPFWHRDLFGRNK